MKTINEIREEIKSANARIAEREQKNKAEAEKIITAWGKLRAGGGQALTLTEAERKHNDEITARIADREQENTRDKLRAEILRENLKAAIFEMLQPIIWETLKKYNGKPYGDKTRDKIAEETKAACGYRVYFAEKYGSGEIKAYSASYNIAESITIYAHNVPIFSGELKNRLREPSDEEKNAFSVAYERARYTEPEQIDAAIDAIIAAHKAAEEAEKAYNAAVARYNNLRPNANEAAKTMYNGVPRI